MTFWRAKPADDLYAEVADYDLVLVPDAPLASALNRRLDVAHFGDFATTPRRLAAGRRERAEDRTAFLEVVDRTTHDWKSLSYAIGNVLQCWEHRGTLDAILDYDQYVDDVTRDVVDIMADLRTTSSRLEAYDPDTGDVAVVGEPLYTTLERSVFPHEYDGIPLFTDDAFDLPPMHLFDAATDIVDAIIETISRDDASNVAVVLEGTSRYASLIESALAANDIPFYGGPDVVDDPALRSYISLCRTAFVGEEISIADVRPVLAQLGIDIAIDHEEKRLHAADLGETAWIRTFCADLGNRTFAESLDAYETRIDGELAEFRAELERLGLGNTRVTEDRFDALVYYLQSYDIPMRRDNEGVLLADAKSSGYVDRPVVFYVGLDEDWTHSAPRRPWVDSESQFDRYLGQFQLLLQSGVNRYNLVQDTAGGQPVTPCLYFGELLADEYDRFSDLESVRYTHHPDDRSPGFDREHSVTAPETIDTISNSSLTTYVNSPRDYFFDRLVDTPDRDYFREGNLFHDFAECYVTHPDVIDEAAIDEVVEVMLADAEPLFSEFEQPLRERSYRIGLETIVEYLDAKRPFETDFLTPSSGWGTNVVAEYFGVAVDAPNTERWFEDRGLKMKGKIDLIAGPNHLLDYKSGRKKRRRDVVKQSAIDPPDDTPDFQAAMYLSYYRQTRPEEPLEFTFFHFLETLDDVVAGTADLDDTLTTVSYYPWTFDEYIASREAYDELLDGYSDCVATFQNLGFAAFREIMGGLRFPDTTDRSELRGSGFADRFAEAVAESTSADVDAEKGVDQAVRRLDGIRGRTYFREDLDAFEAFVEERIDQLNRYRSGEARFPIEGFAGEPNYRRVDHRDLLLEGGDD